MKKVVMLAPTPPPMGGMATWALRVLDGNLKNNWESVLVEERIVGKREMFGNQTKRDLLAEIKRCFRIWGDLKKTLADPEALVVHSSIPAGTGSIIREYVCGCITRNRKRKFIVHFHCTIPNTVRGKLNRFVLKQICKICDGIIVLNQQSKDYLEPITKTPVWIVPNFVDDEELVESHRINETIKTALYVGGVIESKGCLEIIQLAKAYPDIEFRMVGRAESRVTDAAQGLSNVTFVGLLDRDGVRKELENADVFLFLSFFPGEGFSCALTEAMAAGLPCLVSDWAANKIMIEDKGGRVVPVKATQQAIDALSEMMPADIRQVQSQFNINKVRTQYSKDVILGSYVDCYEAVLKG